MIKKGDLYFPTKEFQKRAVISDPKIYQRALKDPVKFWEKLAKEIFWFEKWKKAFEHNPPYFKWFLGGKINITTNIFEKNKLGWEKIKNKPAIIWEPELVEEKPKILTYEDLFKRVCKFANALKKLGVKKGDIVAIYLPMIPEVIVSMLSCARIGAVHLVVFSAFSPSALKTRLQISNAKILITADGYFRRGKIINLKESADEGIKETDVEKVIVVKRLGREIPWDEKRDIWFDELIKNESENCKPEIMDSEDLFFILPESGTTGEFLPILHTCGGYTVQAYWTGKWVFDFQENSIFWSMGDVGWITGHTYTVYSPLLNGITTIIYEGAPDFPEKDRWAKIIEKHKVSIFYTSPTAIRMFRKLNGEITKKYDFKNLRVLGSVGEPIDSSSWLWYFKEIGKEKCPIVDTYWQTETGGIVISSLPGIGPFKPAFAGLPFPGVKVDILDEKGNSCKVGERGNLVILLPFSPGMLRGLYKKPEKYKKVYWGKYGENIYFTSDGAFRDENGLIRIVGRVDDIIKIAGHRISTGELEEAVNSHEKIIESAVVGVPDEIKGEVPVIFAIYKGKKEKEEIKKEILEIIRKRIGPIAPPKEIYLVEDLPRTRSGKIVRKILRELMLGEEIKDLSALANPESVDKIKKLIKK
jgi:acetyl-CoA synthetase